MLEARGESILSEAQMASRVVARTVAGSGLAAQAVVALAVLAAFIVAPFVAEAVAPGSPVVLLAMGVLIGSASAIGATHARQRSFLRGWLARGLRSRSPASFRVQDDGLHIAGDGMDFLVHWRAISEIASGPVFWCVIGPGLGFCLPRTFFETVDAERAFIRAMLERMDEPARDRSRSAIHFVGVWG